MGVSFKENCPDLRNSKVIDIVHNLTKSEIDVDCYDPWIQASEFKKQYGLTLTKSLKRSFYDIVIIAVPHDIFKRNGINKVLELTKSNNVIYDIKGLFDKTKTDGRL